MTKEVAYDEYIKRVKPTIDDKVHARIYWENSDSLLMFGDKPYKRNGKLPTKFNIIMNNPTPDDISITREWVEGTILPNISKDE